MEMIMIVIGEGMIGITDMVVEMVDMTETIDTTIGPDAMMKIGDRAKVPADIDQSTETRHEILINYAIKVRAVAIAAASSETTVTARECHRLQKLHHPQMQLLHLA